MKNEDLNMNDEDPHEIEISIEPNHTRLVELGISIDEFSQIVAEAIDNYWDSVENLGENDEIPDIEEMQICINGKSIRLGDLANFQG